MHKTLLATLGLIASVALTPASAASGTLLDFMSYHLSVDGPNNGYGYNDGGNDLNDGVMDVQVGGGYAAWSPYVLWDGVSPTITFDLDSVQQVGRIDAHFLTYPNAAVTLPLSVTVRYSNDGITFSAAQQVATYDGIAPLTNDTPVTLSLLTPGSGRFVELTLQTPGRWIALSEVQLISAVPEPASAALMLLGGAGVLLASRRRRG